MRLLAKTCQFRPKMRPFIAKGGYFGRRDIRLHAALDAVEFGGQFRLAAGGGRMVRV